MSVTIQAMNNGHIAAGLRLCRLAGWNQLEADWRCFLECSPNGCRVAISDGQVVGTVATLNYEGKFGWISMLLVDPEWRGQGIGMRLLEEGSAMLSDVETVRLDATPAGKRVYDKAGFHDEYPLVRMRATAPVAEAPSGVWRLRDGDWERLLEWDRSAFGADRSGVLRRLWPTAPEYAFMSADGFVLGRHGFLAEHIGPVVATKHVAARALVSAVLQQLKSRTAMVDAPAHTPLWNSWLEQCGFREERAFVRMFRGPNSSPGVPGLVFAIAGPELG